MIFNKLLVLICAALLVTSASIFAKTGTESGGGGDALEERVYEIRSDILKWLGTDGPKGLTLPIEISYEEYVTKMIDILASKKVIISFIEKDDATNDELMVSVDGVPKTCRGFISEISSQPHIICNIARFKNTSESQQYSLIHHEYAGLVNIENNDGAASDYRVSAQLTDFLTEQPVLKLALKKQHPINCKLLVARQSFRKIIYFSNPTDTITGALVRTAIYKSLTISLIHAGIDVYITVSDSAKKVSFVNVFQNPAVYSTSDYSVRVSCD